MKWIKIEEVKATGEIAVFYDDAFEVPYLVNRLTEAVISEFGLYSSSMDPTHFAILSSPCGFGGGAQD